MLWFLVSPDHQLVWCWLWTFLRKSNICQWETTFVKWNPDWWWIFHIIHLTCHSLTCALFRWGENRTNQCNQGLIHYNNAILPLLEIPLWNKINLQPSFSAMKFPIPVRQHPDIESGPSLKCCICVQIGEERCSHRADDQYPAVSEPELGVWRTSTSVSFGGGYLANVALSVDSSTHRHAQGKMKLTH